MLVEVGKVVKAHGIKGDLLVFALTDFPDLRFAVNAKITIDKSTWLTVARSAEHSGRYIVHFMEINDRNSADALVGSILLTEVEQNQLPPVPDRYFDRQLIGLKVIADGADVGVVVDVLHLPSQEVLTVERAGVEVLIPFVEPILQNVDLEKGTISINPPPGLLNLSEAEDAN